MYIVLELMEGGDLFDYLAKRSFKLPVIRIKEVFRGISEAVSHFHSKQILHRDIKLENVLMSSDEEDAVPKIADFGLSCVLGDGQRLEKAYGTSGYMAPEILL